ncbi:DUF1932 domain-containing protein [Brevibacillus fulvus]|uniref:3-hydroxyisobutyrate dehydrogenase-like beta-hydroxyacid dehydrogenase n=1 Tax=Brevibacillus fulvus TaxID=1125967 RepID=A0A939BNT0_9BACL|nr:DUF1932 domain-containing protein [Brevibacillus fulvus]MBM7589590.1 3-hydroxyisobutyrate dehydrogenase-like beta-hydroxyacid dehydrogenase [Brevibacillus fulvus]
MNDRKIGFIGFGEAAFHICSGLKSEGVEQIRAFDVMANDAVLGVKIKERASSIAVTLDNSLRELLEHSQVIFCATSAKYALGIAQEAAEFIGNRHIYVDLNAASPKVKREIASVIQQAGGLFVDGAVMEAVPPLRHKVPILLSGEGAVAFQAFMQPAGMNLTVVNDQAGSASSMKMIRSIFMKGFTALLLETLLASHQAGVEKEIVASISKTLASGPVEQLMNLLLTRTAIHAERRVSEMKDVVETLQEMHLDYTMSQATQTKLQSLVELNLNGYFEHKAPDHYRRVLEAIAALQK